jgi:hypothetical protein
LEAIRRKMGQNLVQTVAEEVLPKMTIGEFGATLRFRKEWQRELGVKLGRSLGQKMAKVTKPQCPAAKKLGGQVTRNSAGGVHKKLLGYP